MQNQNQKNDWLNNFVEKNLWAILGLLVMAGIFVSQVRALENRVQTIETSQIDIVENQKAIIQIQTKQFNYEEALKDIKTDLKDIKTAIGAL